MLLDDVKKWKDGYIFRIAARKQFSKTVYLGVMSCSIDWTDWEMVPFLAVLYYVNSQFRFEYNQYSLLARATPMWSSG